MGGIPEKGGGSFQGIKIEIAHKTPSYRSMVSLGFVKL